MKINDWEIRESVGVSITPGVIQVASASVSIFSETLIVVELDCKSKYPTLICTSASMVGLGADEGTLHRGASEDMTQITLDLPPGFQVGPVEMGRYSVGIFCYRRNDRVTGTLVWEAG